VPFSAGSSSDTIARIVAIKMGERLGQQMIVENRVGGSTLHRHRRGREVRCRRLYALLANTTTMLRARRSTPHCHSIR
jgi:hypothetical protein